MNKTIKIIKNRSDIGAGTRGSDMGIDAIEIAAINQGSQYFNNYEEENLRTHNESVYNKVKNSFAKRIKNVFEQCTRVSNAVELNLKSDRFPLVLSGDHSSALGSISGVKAAYADKRIGVVWVDAHADLHSPYTSPSGNVHGMPLAGVLNEDNLEHQINEVTGDTDKYWKLIKNIGNDGPKVKAEYIIYFGVRSTELPEDHLIAKYNIKNYKVDEIRYRGLRQCVNEATNILSECDVIYISFDVDSMDCDLISRGTGTPVSKGFDQYEAIEIINGIIDTGKVVCFEIAEVNPLLDTKGNKMGETAFEVLMAVTEKIDSMG